MTSVVRVITLSAREMTPLAGSGKAVQYGVGVAAVELGIFQSWRLESESVGPGEGDMTFGGDGVVSSRAREESLAPVSGRAVKAGACDGRVECVCVCVWAK